MCQSINCLCLLFLCQTLLWSAALYVHGKHLNLDQNKPSNLAQRQRKQKKNNKLDKDKITEAQQRLQDIHKINQQVSSLKATVIRRERERERHRIEIDSLGRIIILYYCCYYILANLNLNSVVVF